MQANNGKAQSNVPQNGEALFVTSALANIYQMGEVQVTALVNVDLMVFKGEFIVLLGPSGSGKSTLLNILGGLDTSSSGSAHFADQDMTTATEAELTTYRREHVGFVTAVSIWHDTPYCLSAENFPVIPSFLYCEHVGLDAGKRVRNKQTLLHSLCHTWKFIRSTFHLIQLLPHLVLQQKNRISILRNKFVKWDTLHFTRAAHAAHFAVDEIVIHCVFWRCFSAFSALPE